MANKDLANGFSVADGVPYYAPTKWPLTASQTLEKKDMVILDSAGRISIATYSSASVCGVAYTPCTSSSAGDDVWVFDNPHQQFEGQCSGSGLLAMPYTCNTSTSCYDIEGTTKIMEVNEDSSTYDIIKVVQFGTDPASGARSAVGANQRVVFIVNPAKHQLGYAA